MPRLSVPSFNRSAPHCARPPTPRPPGAAGARSYPRPPGLTPLHQLDAAHFFSTGGDGTAAADQPTPPDRGRLPSVVGGNVAEEYRLLAGSGTPAAAPAVPRPHAGGGGGGGYLELLDLDALRVVFLLLDAILLLHRITNVYVGGLVVSRRCDDSPVSSGRWVTSSPAKTSSRPPVSTTVRVPASPLGGATNYVDDYLSPVELRAAEPPPPAAASAAVAW